MKGTERARSLIREKKPARKHLRHHSIAKSSGFAKSWVFRRGLENFTSLHRATSSTHPAQAALSSDEIPPSDQIGTAEPQTALSFPVVRPEPSFPFTETRVGQLWQHEYCVRLFLVPVLMYLSRIKLCPDSVPDEISKVRTKPTGFKLVFFDIYFFLRMRIISSSCEGR
jgi:hypothetical protein